MSTYETTLLILFITYCLCAINILVIFTGNFKKSEKRTLSLPFGNTIKPSDNLKIYSYFRDGAEDYASKCYDLTIKMVIDANEHAFRLTGKSNLVSMEIDGKNENVSLFVKNESNQRIAFARFRFEDFDDDIHLQDHDFGKAIMKALQDDK